MALRDSQIHSQRQNDLLLHVVPSEERNAITRRMMFDLSFFTFDLSFRQKCLVKRMLNSNMNMYISFPIEDVFSARAMKDAPTSRKANHSNVNVDDKSAGVLLNG